ncbi:MAG TPA: (2Fe-2S)-binding protein [Bryobacteraceae bacterium]|nr:(2Fe-2S)-binding protein [Bryobacteraceae bacterium]
MSSTSDHDPNAAKSGFSRRGFLKSTGVASGAVAAATLTEEAAIAAPAVQGPAAVPITLTINGKPYKATVEPRETLLDTMRNYLDLTAAKRVCDRGTCGACTVLVNGKVSYACTMLAVDSVGKKIETLEGIAAAKHPIVQAFVNNDAQQCGYCTPGMVVASKGFLDKNPNPTIEQMREGMGGNLCRCGTYVGVRRAILEASKQLKGGRNA